MAYTIDIADKVSTTVGKFASLNPHQLSGHLANLDFWVGEIKHALAVLDGYSRRQSNLESGQQAHINRHDTRRFSKDQKQANNEYPWDEGEQVPRAEPDRFRLDKNQLKTKRQEVSDSLYFFLKRCYAERLIEGEKAKACLKECGLGWEPGDFASETSHP